MTTGSKVAGEGTGRYAGQPGQLALTDKSVSVVEINHKFGISVI